MTRNDLVIKGDLIQSTETYDTLQLSGFTIYTYALFLIQQQLTEHRETNVIIVRKKFDVESLSVLIQQFEESAQYTVWGEGGEGFIQIFN